VIWLYVTLLLLFTRHQHVGNPDFEPLSLAYFAVYDGHNGDGTSEFLSSSLHTNIFSDANFVQNPAETITKAFKDTDSTVCGVVWCGVVWCGVVCPEAIAPIH
jgi:hypothetical protein